MTAMAELGRAKQLLHEYQTALKRICAHKLAEQIRPDRSRGEHPMTRRFRLLEALLNARHPRHPKPDDAPQTDPDTPIPYCVIDPAEAAQAVRAAAIRRPSPSPNPSPTSKER